MTDSDDNLAALRALAAEERTFAAENHKRKLDIITTALANGATKDSIARSIGISRPTLDEWLRNREDRILFNDALATLTHPNILTATALDTAYSDSATRAVDLMYNALGVRDTKAQAAAVLEGIHHMYSKALSPEQADLIQRAAVRAWKLM
jgi:transposase-like protein